MTTRIGLISNSDELALHGVGQEPEVVLSLFLNTTKTKEQMETEWSECPVIPCLGNHISEDLTWSTNTTAMVKKAQWLFFLWTLKKAGLTDCCTIASISVWYISCTATDSRAPQRVVCSAQKIIGRQLPALEVIAHAVKEKLPVSVRLHTPMP